MSLHMILFVLRVEGLFQHLKRVEGNFQNDAGDFLYFLISQFKRGHVAQKQA